MVLNSALPAEQISQQDLLFLFKEEYYHVS